MIQFRVERKILKLFGATLWTLNNERQIVCRAEQKAFKLRELVQFYSDDAKTQPLFSIKARRIIDIGATYDIFGADGVTVLASLQREGVVSMFVRDQWKVLDAQGNQIALVREDTETLGLLRRYVDLVALIFPQRYTVMMGDRQIATYQQNRNPFTLRLACEYIDGIDHEIGTALMYAIPNMLAIIEARQN